MKPAAFVSAVRRATRLLAAVSAMASGASEPQHPILLEEEPFHPHHVGIFLGAVSRFEGDEKEHGMAVGIEYELRLSHRWGVGALVEGVTVGQGRELALVAPLSWHPWRGLKLSAGPGFESNAGEQEFLGRVSVGYDFEIGRWSVAPEVSADFTHEAQSLVYGLTVGFGF